MSTTALDVDSGERAPPSEQGVLAAEQIDLSTALKVSEEIYRKLTESEAKFRRLMDCNIVGISVWDLDGRVLEANEMFLRIVGYESDDLISGRLRWTDFASSQGPDRSTQDMVALLQGGG